jgi:N-acyl-phosphatidylethanolamine-hydrolysing phospholipase D
MGTIIAFFKWRFGKKRDPDAFKDAAPYVPVYAEPDLARIKNPDPAKIQLTWVGHSTFLIQAAGMNILTDPIWSDRASPIQWMGPKREARPGIRFEDLPKIDVVVISHTHYDHLDRRTVSRLGNSPRYFIPTRTAWWFKNEGVTNVSELDWWHSEKAATMHISAVPAKHWSKRGLFRTEDAGWGGYMIESPAGAIYFAGDTGYNAEYFKEIGKRFPKIDVGLIPIGAYYPQSFFGRFHIDPREAVIVHKEVAAKRSIGMHWGTIKLTEEPLQEPPLELARQASAAGLAAEEFSVMKIGETRTL